MPPKHFSQYCTGYMLCTVKAAQGRSPKDDASRFLYIRRLKENPQHSTTSSNFRLFDTGSGGLHVSTQLKLYRAIGITAGKALATVDNSTPKSYGEVFARIPKLQSSNIAGEIDVAASFLCKFVLYGWIGGCRR